MPLWRSREERRKDKFIRKVRPLLAESQQMKANMFVQVAKEEIDTGKVRTLEEWASQWDDSEDLSDALTNYTQGMQGLLSESRSGEITEAIRWERDFPSWVSDDALTHLLAERTRYLVSELRRRGLLSGPSNPA